MNELVTIENGKLTTTSRVVAEKFGKNHKDVLRAIRNLDCSEEYHQRNFAPMIEMVQTGKGAERESPVYQITRDGFIFLATGFTGKEAAQWKEKFITTFNDMEKALIEQANPQIPQTYSEALRLAADLVDRNKMLLSEVEEMLPQVNALKRISASDEASTMTQASKVLGVKLSVLTSRLHAEGWVYRQNESWVAYDRYIKNGCLVYKEATYTDEKTGLKVIKPYCHVTQKGITKLAMLFATKEAA